MRANVKAVMDVIDDVLVRQDRDSVDLWMILSALRGPDNEEEDLKRDTTAQIRRIVFPRLYQAIRRSGFAAEFVRAARPWMDQDNEPRELLRQHIWSHFGHHVNRAIEAIEAIEEPSETAEEPSEEP